MSYARDERAALCRLLETSGPEAPTLCEGWQTRHLAAHLVLRERRPDAAVGILGGPLATHTERVLTYLAATTAYPRLVDLVRTGPPRISPFRIPGMEEKLNLVEFFTHHEDVRRAAGGWDPRDLGPGETEVLWQRLRLARLNLRRVAVGVELVRDDLPSIPGRRQVRITVKARTPVVTVTGHPAELMLWAMGRRAVARVRLDGSDSDVSLLRQASWRV